MSPWQGPSTLANEGARRWESLINGYMPPAELVVDPSLHFDQRFEADIDPITHEVIRSKFWNLNWDHQETIRRTAGSLVVVQGYDFNTSIQTEFGEGVVFGPGNLFFAGCADVVIKWTLEHRSMNVGINDGDVFIQDDPWIGTNHAMDTAVYRPVFVEGKLFAWVYNVAHQRELGGVEAGGFVQTAKDAFYESTFWPPVKIVDGGKLREDLVDAWVRRSRLPGLMTVELKAQLAGVHVAYDRLRQLIDRYGAPVIKGVMRKMISDTAATVSQRLQAVPDGTWRDTRYVAGALPGDRNMYKLSLTFIKKGDKVHVTNEGTDPAVGSFNCTPGLLRSCVVSPLLLFLAYDQYLCGAGLLEQLDFQFVEGAINSARHPSAISTSIGLTMSLVQTQYLAAKMLSSSEQGRKHIFAACGLHTLITNHMFGVDQWKRAYAHFPFDGTVGAIGAFPFRDGIHHGGGAFSTANPVGSVEAYEQEIPFIYLYRREVPDSGGHGQWRGGATFVSAWTGHKSHENYISSGGLFTSVTQGIGLMGAYPSSGGTMWHALDTPILELLREGRMPSTPEELRAVAPDGSAPPPKKFDNRLRPGDLFEVMPQPGAGYGDPLLRDLDSMRRDLREGRVSVEDARRIYGVVVDAEGDPDAAASAAAREGERKRRRQAARPRDPRDGRLDLDDVVASATATVSIGRQKGTVVLGCADCGQVLGAAGAGYRRGCQEVEMPLPSISPLFMDPRRDVEGGVVFRLYICPGCGLALDSEICRPEDDAVRDVEFDASVVSAWRFPATETAGKPSS